MKSYLSFADFDMEELSVVFARMKEIKRQIKLHERRSTLEGRIIALLFEKPSTRTVTGFETAILRLGGYPLYFSSNELQLSRGEPIKDTARVVGPDVDAIVARVFSHDTLIQLQRYSDVPVVNALSDLEHPTQVVSDLFTISEIKGRLKGLRLSYIGDGDNVCNSLLLGAATVGMHMTVACPNGYEPDPNVLARAQKIARVTGAILKISHDPKQAASNSDVLYTDVWVSMGEESETQRRIRDFQGYQINSDLLRVADKNAIVMHCLPAHRGLEITEEVLEGSQSIVWHQAENKEIGAAGILEFLLQRAYQKKEEVVTGLAGVS